MNFPLEHRIKDEAHRLGFILAGVTTPDPPPHLAKFEEWLMQGRHATMNYLVDEGARKRRADARLILPDCKSILLLAISYSKPADDSKNSTTIDTNTQKSKGKIAAYAWGNDYHVVLPKRLTALVRFIEEEAGHPVSNRWYTDTGPVLERDMAQRAGLGWIGKNTCLIHPKLGSYFLLSEILLGLELKPDTPWVTDHCGTCHRCIEACPTDCILPDRTIDAGRCISYLTIELKDSVPAEIRPLMGNWVFGCDICQQVCPWNRFARTEGDPDFKRRGDIPEPNLIHELELTPAEFNRKFLGSPIKRAKRSGYLRNTALAIGNVGGRDAIPSLKKVVNDSESMTREHAAWAIKQILKRHDEVE